MIWQNGWAWFGLASILVPLAVHLLATQRPRVERFPTLRFLEPTSLVQARRARLSDLLLLLVRISVVLAAVAALAQPLFLSGSRRDDLGSTVARVVILDTSASMNRPAPSGERALDLARREADRLLSEATTGQLIESARPASLLPAAASWLASRGGKREIVVFSDFQTGVLHPADLAVVPPQVGFRVVRSEVADSRQPLEWRMLHSGHESIARVALDGWSTGVEWTTAAATIDSVSSLVETAADPSERADAAAAMEAALSLGVPPASGERRPVSLIYPGFERGAAVLRGAQPLDERWMGDVALIVSRDPLLAAAARDAEPITASGAPGDTLASDTNVITLVRNGAGEPVVLAARVALEGVNTLALVSLVDAGTVASAALASAAMRALAPGTPMSELDPQQVSPETLRQLEREAAVVLLRGQGEPAGISDGRWFWIIALALLVVEWRMRRTVRRPAAADALP